MADEQPTDYYELLQLSPNADLDTIHRVYRLLAQRLHPDNRETGNPAQFRALTEAYQVLGHPETRAQYDVTYHQQKQDRWRLVSSGTGPDNDFARERALRLTLLEVLYTRRRVEPTDPAMFNVELAELLGQPREHLEFTIWFLLQKGLITRTDNSKLSITAAGAEFLEAHYHDIIQQRRLNPSPLAQ